MTNCSEEKVMIVMHGGEGDDVLRGVQAMTRDWGEGDDKLFRRRWGRWSARGEGDDVLRGGAGDDR